jgi:heptosyltransferase-3
MKLKTAGVSKMMYWAFRRDPSVLPHLFAILVHFGRNYIRLLVWNIVRRRPIVAIGQIEFMGDILAAEPISRAARKQFPDAYIVWVARKPFREMIESFAAVDNVITVECLTEWMLLLSTGVCDTVWDLHVSDHICAKCRAPLHKSGLASGIVYETFYDFGNLLTIACLCAGIPPITDAPALDLDRGVVKRVDALDLPDDFVVLHCTANDQQRNWTVTKWKALATYITETLGRKIVEVGLTPVVVGTDTVRARSLCGKLSIVETAEVIRRAVLFIGVDSGPAHLANAVGTPGVLLFGRFGPWHNHMPYSGAYQAGVLADLVRTSGPLRDLPVEAVTRAVAHRLDRPAPPAGSSLSA